MNKTAIIIGATGLTGGIVLNRLLADHRYHLVRVLTRRSLDLTHCKLQEHVIDMQDLNSYSSLFNADELYCCVGTTKAKTPHEEVYRSIDFGIPVNAARLCKENGISTFVVVSSLGADVNSRMFYSRLKGEMEAAVLNYEMEKTIIVRPSLITGPRQERRFGEQVGKLAMKVVNPFLIGALKVYRTIEAQTIAKAMIWLANNPTEKAVFLSDELKYIEVNEY